MESPWPVLVPHSHDLATPRLRTTRPREPAPQSKPLYEAFQALRDSGAWASQDEARRRAVELELRDFVLGGVGLQGAARERFNEVQQELSALSTKFSNNLLDATKAWKKLVSDPAVVQGLPPTALAAAAQAAAREPGHEGATPETGPWLFTLDFPSYFPVMTYAKDRCGGGVGGGWRWWCWW